MTRTFHGVLAGALVLAGVACSDSVTDPTLTTLADAFAPQLTGYNQAQSTFSTGTDGGMTGGTLGGRGRHGGGFGMMGGGLGGAFLGAGLGSGFGNRPVSDASCTFSSSTGRVSCEPVTHNGLTITRSLAYSDASGAVQSAFDSLTTNTINTRTTATGTVVSNGELHRGGRHGFDRGGSSVAIPRSANDTTTIQLASERTVSGLAQGSSERTVNGTSAGTETTTGTDNVGHFTVERVAGDTTTGVVIPVVTTGRAYPTAGTVVRSMQVAVTYDGQASQTSTRREVITYDGSDTAQVVITQDGETTTGTIALPGGRLSCR
jgi:hypothetical protein